MGADPDKNTSNAFPPPSGAAVSRPQPETGNTQVPNPRSWRWILLAAIIGAMAIGGTTTALVMQSVSNEDQAAAPPSTIDEVEQPATTEPPAADSVDTESSFEIAYSLVCSETVDGLYSIRSAIRRDSSQVFNIIGDEAMALGRRLSDVRADTEVWSATDPTIYDYASDMAQNLRELSSDSRTEANVNILNTDGTLFPLLCEEWLAEG